MASFELPCLSARGDGVLLQLSVMPNAKRTTVDGLHDGALLYGLERGWPLVECVKLGNRIGAVKIAYRGGQNHPVDKAALGA